MLRSRNPDRKVGEVLQYRFIYYLITEERFKRNKKLLIWESAINQLHLNMSIY